VPPSPCTTVAARLYAEQQDAAVQKQSEVVPSAAGSSVGMFAMLSVGFLAAGVGAAVWKTRRVRRSRQVGFVQPGASSDLEDPLE